MFYTHSEVINPVTYVESYIYDTSVCQLPIVSVQRREYEQFIPFQNTIKEESSFCDQFLSTDSVPYLHCLRYGFVSSVAGGKKKVGQLSRTKLRTIPR